MSAGRINEDVLLPARKPVKRPRCITTLLEINLACRALLVGGLAYLGPTFDVTSPETLLSDPVLIAIEAEMLLMIIFVQVWCRWEAQGHLISIWQVMTAAIAFVIRRSIYVSPWHFAVVLLLLAASYIVGMMADFRQSTPIRLPPFPPKASDLERPRYGWLGPHLAKRFRTKSSRLLIVFVMWLSYQTRILLIFYFGSCLTEKDDLTESPVLDTLWIIQLVIAAISLSPNAMVCFASIPELCRDWRYGLKASKGYKTEPYEVALLDDDSRPDSVLSKKLTATGHQCRSMTIIVPCYMPNEEEIIFDVIDYYKVQAKQYPGEMRLMVVWNSPREHADTEEKLKEVAKDWPVLSVHRNPWSTSKCDNLNLAIGLMEDHPELETEFALLNDADTMVSAQTMIRASILLFEEGYSIAQSHSTHCYLDKVGMPESGCFAFGAFVTLFDSTKPLNMATQGMYKHSPFNGRGGFWRVSALKKVHFDHRCIGEDHDAGYRLFAAYGETGILDQNLLCQEREPPDCKSLNSQRIRWETAALEMRRTFPWILRSKHYGNMEAFVLIWSQLCWNCNLPMQQAPLQMMQLLPLAVTKSYLTKHVYGRDFQEMCAGEDCLYTFTTQSGVHIAGTMLFVLLLGIFGLYLFVCIIDWFIRLNITRYRPRIFWAFFGMVVVPFIMMPWLVYLQFWALNDYCWGGAKFIATTRSPSGTSPKAVADGGGKDQKGLQQPLLK